MALAFAGNDLVNFIGVPIAAWQSYEAWSMSGIPAAEFSMNILAKKVPTPTFYYLHQEWSWWLCFGSLKKRYVAETEVNLAREENQKSALTQTSYPEELCVSP